MTTTKPKANEIPLSRFYEAPVSAVWDAWTDEKQAAQWWGPRGFTITTHSKDFRVDGHWHYTMHGPNGADYVNKTKYFEIEKEKKMVYDHGGNDEHKPLFRVTVEFKAVNGGTEMHMTMACPTAENAEQTRGFIKKAGGNATWDRLAEYLAKNISNKDVFVINRSFDAPIETMRDRWTNPDHFSKWLAAPLWPGTMQTTVKFSEEGPHKTRVTVTWEVAGKPTSEEMDTFIKGRAGMTEGWTGSFDKLEDTLPKIKS